jgi:AcrR family transcriptional regulator
MSDHDEITHQQTLLQTHRQTLVRLLDQMAMQGAAYAPPAIAAGIDEARNAIRVLKISLRNQGVIVEEALTDEPFPASVSAQSTHMPRRSYDTPTGTRVSLSHFGEGMGALYSLIQQAPDIYDSAITFRTNFQAACTQIEALRAYKALHDLLHDLQLLCYEHIEQELQRFPDDDLAADNLERYALNLEDIVNSLQEIAERTPSIKPRPTWIDKLHQAHTSICQALATTDAEMLKRATREIKRVLSLHPAQINTRLNSTVQAMRLEELLEVMTHIHTVCLRLDVDSTLLSRFTTGLTALGDLHQRLMALVDDHDQWQDVDTLLRLIDDSMDYDELSALWPDVKEQANRLYATSAEQWAQALRANEAQLERAVAIRDNFILFQSFCSYRSRAVRQFYRVDKRLKELCDRLDRLDGPLALVMGVLQ